MLIKKTALLGNVYIADCENNRIRKVTVSTGIITTVAGGGTDDASALAEYTGSATSASLEYPIAVGVDISGKLSYIYFHILYLLYFAKGNVYIAENNHCVVRKVTVSTDTIAALAGTGNCSFSGDGGQATLAWLNQPYALAADSEGITTRLSFFFSIIYNILSYLGNVYIADSSNMRVRKVTASTGIITTFAGNGGVEYNGDNGQATSASLDHPQALAVDSSGNKLTQNL